MGAGKRLYSFSPGVYSMFSLQFFWVWEGGLGKMHNKYLNKQTKNKKQITEKKNPIIIVCLWIQSTHSVVL